MIDINDLIYAEDEYGGFLCTPKYYEYSKNKYGSVICYRGSLKDISEYMCYKFSIDNIFSLNED